MNVHITNLSVSDRTTSNMNMGHPVTLRSRYFNTDHENTHAMTAETCPKINKCIITLSDKKNKTIKTQEAVYEPGQTQFCIQVDDDIFIMQLFDTDMINVLLSKNPSVFAHQIWTRTDIAQAVDNIMEDEDITMPQITEDMMQDIIRRVKPVLEDCSRGNELIQNETEKTILMTVLTEKCPADQIETKENDKRKES